MIQANLVNVGIRPKDINLSFGRNSSSVPRSKGINFDVPGVLGDLNPGANINKALQSAVRAAAKELPEPDLNFQKFVENFYDGIEEVFGLITTRLKETFDEGRLIEAVLYGVVLGVAIIASVVTIVFVEAAQSVVDFFKKVFGRSKKGEGFRDIDIDGDGIPDPVGDVRPSFIVTIAPRMFEVDDQIANLEGGRMNIIMGNDARSFAANVRFDYEGVSAENTIRFMA